MHVPDCFSLAASDTLQAWTAIFTGGAALAALATAIVTRRMVRPLLVVTCASVTSEPVGGARRLQVHIRNAGAGIAVLVSLDLNIKNAQQGEAYHRRLTRRDFGHRVLAGGTETRIIVMHDRAPFWEDDPVRTEMTAQVIWSSLTVPAQLAPLVEAIPHPLTPRFPLAHAGDTGSGVSRPAHEWISPGSAADSRHLRS
jgi:hypothetical protein